MTPRTLPTATALALLALAGCAEEPEPSVEPDPDDPDPTPEARVYDVRVRHHAPWTPVREVGTFPALAPGEQAVVRIHAGPGHRLGLATMMTETNDVFIGSDWGGVPLYQPDETPRQGDITRDFYVFDANTEMDRPMGTGPDQGARQDSPDQGRDEDDPRQVVKVDTRGWEVGPNGMQYPVPEEIIDVELVYQQDGVFDVLITNVGDDVLEGGLPLSDGAWVVHHPEWGLVEFDGPTSPGVELLAEAGDPSLLVDEIEPFLGGLQPLGPAVFALTSAADPAQLFAVGEEASPGLEMFAEDGIAKLLLRELAAHPEVLVSDVVQRTNGSDDPDLLDPFDVYQFQVEALPEHRLHVLLHYTNGNDWYVATEVGVPLRDGSDASPRLALFDAGTEEDRRPGVHVTQAAHQPIPDLGEPELGTIQRADGTIDGFEVPYADELLKLTVRLWGSSPVGANVDHDPIEHLP